MKHKLAWSLLVVGVVALGIGAAGAAGHVHKVRDVLDAPTHPAPGVFHQRLTRGEWEVYDFVGTRHSTSIGPISGSDEQLFPPTAFSATATGPGGQILAITPRSSDVALTVTRGSSLYRAEAELSVQVPGRYTFRVGTVDGQPTSIVVAPDLASVALSVLAWAAAAGLGLLVGVLGLILLLVQRRADHPPSGPWGPPQWGAPVSGSGR